MSSTKKNGDTEDWEYEDEEAEDYEWEYSEGEENGQEAKGDMEDEQEAEEGIPIEEQELPDPFSSTPLTTTTEKDICTSKDEVKSSTNGDKKKHRSKDENGEKKPRKKKSRHLDRIEAFSKKNGEGDSRSKKIHVRSKDPSRIARQFEKNSQSKVSKSRKDVKRPIPPQQKVNQICKICEKEPYLVERIVAEKSWWHKNCFKCHQCKKILNLDTYVSHEGVIYCKVHHRELFQPKTVKSDIIDVNSSVNTSEVVLKHEEQARRMETIIRESNPVELTDVVKCNPDGEKYAGLEHLDVGSKFKMFESGHGERGNGGGISSDRYGIMEKLKRLQDGEELEDLLAEIDEELPSSSEEEDEIGMTNVQKKMHHAEKLFEEGGTERKNKLAEERKKELKGLRKKLTGGTRDSIMKEFDDIMLQKDSKIKKTKVDVRSENAKKFRDMFDKGEVPEAVVPNDKSTFEKNQELDQIRKKKHDQLDFFKQMEEGKLEDKSVKPKLLVGKIKQTSEENIDDIDEAEMSLSNKFTFFEHFEEKQEELLKKGKKTSRLSPSRWTQGNEEDEDAEETKKYMSETEIAKRECKARSVLNKFKDMEQKVLNGEDDVGDRPRLKQFTPPRKHGTSDSESEYSDSDYTDSYTDGSDYSYSESEEEEVDETLRAIRATARAKQLRAKFEEWEDSPDAKDQIRQMMIHDENGESLETTSNLKAKFESFKLGDENTPGGRRPHFQIKRFK
uniref:LIM domain protein [Acyrthosiphon pisum] n=1 Tax=Lepeophtheirus salmonis TaxID=72036 RepID=A0A0K2TVP8_LEPSM